MKYILIWSGMRRPMALSGHFCELDDNGTWIRSIHGIGSFHYRLHRTWADEPLPVNDPEFVERLGFNPLDLTATPRLEIKSITPEQFEKMWETPVGYPDDHVFSPDDFLWSRWMRVRVFDDASRSIGGSLLEDAIPLHNPNTIGIALESRASFEELVMYTGLYSTPTRAWCEGIIEVNDSPSIQKWQFDCDPELVKSVLNQLRINGFWSCPTVASGMCLDGGTDVCCVREEPGGTARGVEWSNAELCELQEVRLCNKILCSVWWMSPFIQGPPKTWLGKLWNRLCGGPVY